MALRPRELNRRQTVQERHAREEEKLMFRTLEECKQIPKNDRLEIREEIKKQPRELIELFRHYRKNPKNLQNFQIALRKYLARIKSEREGQVLRNVKEELLKSIEKPSEKRRSHSQNKSLAVNSSEPRITKPRWFRQALQRSAEKRKSANQSQNGAILGGSNSRSQLHKHREFQLQSPFKSPNEVCSASHSPVNSHRRSDYQPRSGYKPFDGSSLSGVGQLSYNMSPRLGENSTKPIAQFSSFNFYTPSQFGSDPAASNININSLNYSNTKTSMVAPNQNLGELFTDPKMLEECRGFLSKAKVYEPPAPNSFTFSFPQARVVETQFGTLSQNSLCLTPRSQQKYTKDMFQFFRGKDAEDVVSWFFEQTPVITRNEFKLQLKDFLRANGFPEQSEANLNTYFDVINGVKVRDGQLPQQITISQLGRVADQFSLKSLTNIEVRNIFQRLDSENLGRLVRCLFSDSKWTTLFAKADYDDKGYIGYWELFSVRRSWQYMNFVLWYRERSIMSSGLRVGVTDLY